MVCFTFGKLHLDKVVIIIIVLQVYLVMPQGNGILQYTACRTFSSDRAVIFSQTHAPPLCVPAQLVSADQGPVWDWKLPGFSSLISTPGFVNAGAYQPPSYPDLQGNLGVGGLPGDPNIFNEALKHLTEGPRAPATPTRTARYEGRSPNTSIKLIFRRKKKAMLLCPALKE